MTPAHASANKLTKAKRTSTTVPTLDHRRQQECRYAFNPEQAQEWVPVFRPLWLVVHGVRTATRDHLIRKGFGPAPIIPLNRPYEGGHWLEPEIRCFRDRVGVLYVPVQRS